MSKSSAVPFPLPNESEAARESEYEFDKRQIEIHRIATELEFLGMPVTAKAMRELIHVE